jgi:hypothetical protein
MTKQINLRASILATFTLLLISYLLCIGGDLVFGWTMYESWMPLFPGFTWPLSGSGFLLGLIWVAVYSVYVPALFVLPYNYVVSRTK